MSLHYFHHPHHYLISPYLIRALPLPSLTYRLRWSAEVGGAVLSLYVCIIQNCI